MSGLFAYGTLLFPEVLRAVTGRRLAGRPATLDRFVRRGVTGELFPAVVEANDGDSVRGLLYLELDERDWRTLDRFEGALYERCAVIVRCESGVRPGPSSRAPSPAADECHAFTYVLGETSRHRLGPDAWDEESFAREHLAALVARIASRRTPQ